MLGFAQRAVEAAVAAGATYADVRLTHSLEESISGSFMYSQLFSHPSKLPIYGIEAGNAYGPGASLQMGIGVRAFVHGYWGFASSPYWTLEEAAHLGQEAAGQATRYARGKPRLAELGTIPIVRNARWVQSGIDPFTVPIDEKLDLLRTMAELGPQYDRYILSDGPGLGGWREERVFASSEGASNSQVRFSIGLTAVDRFPGESFGTDWDDLFPQREGTGVMMKTDGVGVYGWELYRDLKLDEVVPHRWTMRSTPPLAYLTSTIGGGGAGSLSRWGSMISCLPATRLPNWSTRPFGMASDRADRALGCYEANASGTPAIWVPIRCKYLGTPVAAPCISLTANRATPHGLTTVPWDDEGVACQAFPLITKGVLVDDYQTTREQAAWLAPWYTQHGLPIQSHRLRDRRSYRARFSDPDES